MAVVVVNAEQLAAGRDLDDTFEQQVSSADLLVLNQIDRVPESLVPELEARLRDAEPDAPILATSHARIAPELLFPPDVGGLRARRRSEGRRGPAPRTRALLRRGADAARGRRERGGAREAARTGALCARKGFVRTSEGVRLVQGVGARIELSPTEVTPPAEMLGRVVVIRRPAPPGQGG